MLTTSQQTNVRHLLQDFQDFCEPITTNFDANRHHDKQLLKPSVENPGCN